VTVEPKIERWRADVVQIGSEVQAMHQRRDIFRRVGEITTKHGALPPSVFFGFVNETYGAAQATAVRRQADRRRDVVSLWRLLTEIKASPSTLSRKWHIAMYGPGFEPIEYATWQLYADPSDDHVNPKLTAQDLDALARTAEKAKRWVDAHVAHTGRERLDVGLTYGELDTGIDALGALMRRYDLLLRGASWVALTPSGIERDLSALFSEPWIKGE
jgi:hypothetical protein